MAIKTFLYTIMRQKSKNNSAPAGEKIADKCAFIQQQSEKILEKNSEKQSAQGPCLTETQHVRLDSVHNFRDIAGKGYRTQNGLLVRPGILYRSSVLTPNSADLALLDSLHLRGVYDLRTAEEIAETPVQLPTNIEYIWIDIIGHNEELIFPSPDIYTSTFAARKYLAEMNRSFVNDAIERHRLGRVLKLIAYNSGSQVFHCSSGKDRTGWLAAIIHLILGMSEQDVLYDYLLSNTYSAAFIQKTTEQAEQSGGSAAKDAMTALMSVNPEALAAGLTEIDQHYGTVHKYVCKGLGLDEEGIHFLQEKLLIL